MATQADRWLLSIHEDSNANASLFRGTRPVAAIAEERLTRQRFAAGFPHRAVRACLDIAGIELRDVDVVLPANKHHFLPRITERLLPDGEHDYFGAKHKAWLYFQHALTRQPALQWATEQLSRVPLKRRFPQLASFVDHHTAHAYSAYLTSGFESALAVTADNMGDGWSSKVFSCRGGRCHFEYGSSARHSPGQFYGEIAQLLGFHNLMAGKVTGLAAYGDPRPAYQDMVALFSLNPEMTGFQTPGLMWRRRDRGRYLALKERKPVDVAAAAQRRLEDVLVAYVREAVRRTGLSSVVLAGGCFANVAVNHKVLAIPEVERIYVHPAMTDQGISMGAALCWLAEHSGEAVPNAPLENIYLGPESSEEEMAELLEGQGLHYERPADMEAAVVDELCEGRVVARCAGRMEYGLRALGNRSILYPAHDREVNGWLNARLRRSEFMPFAPVTLAERAGDCYEAVDGGELAARYMTVTFGVTDAVRSQSPGVVHIDGTARPQLLQASDNPSYYRILKLYEERMGIPSLINTSFNMHSEPIVCTAEDAVQAFCQSRLDRLALGPFLVHRPTRA